ncbi:MAG TPA: DUF4974 domain-containing protein [Candidatus Butyricimonas faecavium]|nr:DUF4974 domain-containing protein [Candidatus Butyricimonas faecavium]
MEWCNQNKRNSLFFQQICEENLLAEEHVLYEATDTVRAISEFKRKLIVPVDRSQKLKINWWKYAAILILPLLVTVMWLWQHDMSEVDKLALQENSLSPGSRQAMLVLDNGKQISLTSKNDHEIQVAQEVRVSQQADKLVYEVSSKKMDQTLSFNELIIPRGGEYKVVLSDGTQVYLNSATRMRYPVVFNAEERNVYLEGEAYFEVVKDRQRPFLVEINGIQIKVYGTSFNVNSHKEGKVQTVLVEGSVGVRVLSTGKEKRLYPGEMAEFREVGESIEIKKVNPELYTEWRRGSFRFENERLEDILTTLSNWYNVDIFYQNQEVKDFHFTGFLGRYKNINTILSSITLATGVRFNIQGKTIIVSK